MLAKSFWSWSWALGYSGRLVPPSIAAGESVYMPKPFRTLLPMLASEVDRAATFPWSGKTRWRRLVKSTSRTTKIN